MNEVAVYTVLGVFAGLFIFLLKVYIIRQLFRDFFEKSDK